MIARPTRTTTAGTALLVTAALGGVVLTGGGALPWTNAPWVATTIAGLADSATLLGSLGVTALLLLAVRLVARRRAQDPDALQPVATPVVSRRAQLVMTILVTGAILLPITITLMLDRSRPRAEPTSSTAQNHPAVSPNSPMTPDQPIPTRSPSTSLDPGWWPFLVLLAVSAAILTVALLIRRSRRTTQVGGRLRTPLGHHAARNQIVTDDQIPTETRAAILVCYAAVEAEFARAGLSRRAAETPAELIRRVVDTAEESRTATGGAALADAGQSLSRLYDEARFSDHALPKNRRDEALAALAGVRAAVRSRA